VTEGSTVNLGTGRRWGCQIEEFMVNTAWWVSTCAGGTERQQGHRRTWWQVVRKTTGGSEEDNRLAAVRRGTRDGCMTLAPVF
jgi:hypothetical protein